MNFIFEIDEKLNIPSFDFVYQAIKSVDYQKGNFNREVCRATIDKLQVLHGEIDYKSWCPVGSVGFVHKWFTIHGIKIPRPINIPMMLFEFSSLEPVKCGGGVFFDYPFFQKSSSTIKHELNGIGEKATPPGEWQVTKFAKDGFLSEHRFFIHSGRIIDYRCYSGEYDNIPCGIVSFAEKCIKKWITDIPAFTIDVGTIDGKTWEIIEAHHFYSCGLYGATMWNCLPQMLSQWYSWWIRSGQFNQ